jgi:hypothetical protein
MEFPKNFSEFQKSLSRRFSEFQNFLSLGFSEFQKISGFQNGAIQRKRKYYFLPLLGLDTPILLTSLLLHNKHPSLCPTSRTLSSSTQTSSPLGSCSSSTIV